MVKKIKRNIAYVLIAVMLLPSVYGQNVYAETNVEAGDDETSVAENDGIIADEVVDSNGEEDEYIDFEYILNEDETEATITGYTGTETELAIPSEIGGAKVTSVGNIAFIGCDNLISITIPEGVTSIEESAFQNCDNLENITIPESVTNIEAYAFSGCSSLTDITIPVGVTSIAKRTFSNCRNLMWVTIPEGVKSIGEAAFEKCDALTKITIPDSVTDIGINAFSGCSELVITCKKDSYMYTYAFENNITICVDGVLIKPYVAVEEIVLDNTDLHLLKGNSVKLNATIMPEDATDKSVIWISDETDVATVDETGKVTANNVGTATITCIAADGSEVKATCTISVQQPIKKIGLCNVLLTKGQSLVMKPDIEPEDASSRNVTWSSDNPDVVTVDENGKITAKEYGTATITCIAADGSGVSDTCIVSVKQLVNEIILDKNSVSILKGQSVKIDAKVMPEDATDKSVNWSSDNPDVATVDENGNVTAKSIGTTFVQCLATDENVVRAICYVTVTQPVTEISLDKTTATMVKEDTITLTNTITPEDATDKSVIWTSDNTDVATVDETGTVTAVSAGTATITCTAVDGSGVTATCIITVTQPVTEINLDKTTATILKGKTLTLTATVTPEDAIDKRVIWTSDNTDVAMVSSTGKVTARAKGTATITCTAKDGSGITATCKVTVKQPVASIKLNATSKTLMKGKYITLKAAVAPSTADMKSVTWKSSNTKVATVSSTGKVTAKAKGTATITCTAKDGSGRKATCKITVTQPVTKIKLSKTSATISKGKTLTLKAMVTPTTANNRSVTWKSSNTKIATVSSSGKVTAKAKGTVTITCTARDGSGKKATCKITVR